MAKAVDVRVRKVTVKAMEEKLQRAINEHKAKLAKLTRKVKQMQQKMDEDGDDSVTAIQNKMNEFNILLGEFCDLNNGVKRILHQLSEEDMHKDQANWFEPKANGFTNFAQKVEAWIKEAQLRSEEASKYNEAIRPSDSISNASLVKSCSKASSVHSSRASSTASSTRLKAELERAALLAKASALRRKQILEEQEAKIKREKEDLEMQTALAASDAKIKLLSEFEGSFITSRASSYDGKGSTVNKRQSSHENKLALQVNNIQPKHQTPANATVQPQTQLTETLQDVAEILTKQQRLATLPPQNIPVFKGDPLEYLPFKGAFEHGVESKTESNRDRLYYMEQYTAGQPRELVRSCLHMEPERGHREAKRLLEEHFGNAYKISVSYIDKALNWPTIKSDDGENLQSFGLYLTGCRNAMTRGVYG